MKESEDRVGRFDVHLIRKNRIKKSNTWWMVETLPEFMKDINSQFK